MSDDALQQLVHDLRTPLTVVLGFSELLSTRAGLTDEQRAEFADQIAAGAKQMRDLLDSAAGAVD